ncbi:SpoIID/LytB domain-containing protein [Patescibacteria group bacterium]
MNKSLKFFKLFKYIFFLLLILVPIFLFILSPSVKADELEELAKQITELENAKQMSIDATKPLEAELLRLDTKLNNIQLGIQKAEANLIALEESIVKREKDFEVQYVILSERVENFYKRLRQPSGFLLLMSSKTATSLAKDLSYRQAVADEDKKIIAQISGDLLQLEKDKKKAEQDRATLAVLKEKTDVQAAFFRKEIQGAKSYQQDLEGKIAELSAKQKELLEKKTGTFQTSVGDVPLADDPASRPDYSPGFSPAFAAFSFGAPHFKGMSQYGAFGRAKNGQNFESIVKAYYGNVRVETVDTNFNINTDQGSLSLEDNYLKGIAEMPSSWGDEGGMEALKAQAIAARSYALSYVGWRMGARSATGTICTSENCQVYRASKASDGAAAKWHQAVADTKGKIVVSNSSNEIVNTWYASTSGGYQESYASLGHSTPGMWDTKCGSKDCWTGDAWEKISGSPWFYKGWYKSRSGISCGRSHPWLTSAEMADILNAVIVYIADENTISHLSQEDSSCWGTPIPDTWDKNRLAQEANKHDGAITSVSSASVTYRNDGITAQVTFSTNRGSVPLDGSKFYKIFNLRAPGAIHLKSGLFNIEKK